MKPRAAEQWMVRFYLFCAVRGRFWQIAFNTDATGRALDDREEYSHRPAAFRALWSQALREAGGGLTAAAALELMQLGSAARRQQIEEAIRALGMTAAGRKKYNLD